MIPSTILVQFLDVENRSIDCIRFAIYGQSCRRQRRFKRFLTSRRQRQLHSPVDSLLSQSTSSYYLDNGYDLTSQDNSEEEENDFKNLEYFNEKEVFENLISDQLSLSSFLTSSSSSSPSPIQTSASSSSLSTSISKAFDAKKETTPHVQAKNVRFFLTNTEHLRKTKQENSLQSSNSSEKPCIKTGWCYNFFYIILKFFEVHQT